MLYKTQCEAVKVCRQGLATFKFSAHGGSAEGGNNFFLLVKEVAASYDFRDPKEKSRLEFYYNLLEKYQYPIERIEFDVVASLAASDCFADIVVFRDNERKIPFIAADCLRDGVSMADFKIGIKNAVAKASALGADFAVCVSGNKKRVIKLSRDKGLIAQKIIRDLPIGYEE